MSWARGRDVIERLLSDGELESVEASTDVATQLLKTHVLADASPLTYSFDLYVESP